MPRCAGRAPATDRNGKLTRKISPRWLVIGALIVSLNGCTISTTRYGWPGSYAPAGIPNAQNCVPFSFGQPTEFACPGGKTYTALQLKDLRKPKANISTVASTAGY